MMIKYEGWIGNQPANQGIAARSKASVNIHPTLCAGVGSTPADDAGQTCWTSCGKVAIFCNL